MALDRFMIAPINGGLETDLKPWLVPEDSMARLNNAYIFRGRIRKRFGSRWMNSAASSAVGQLSSRVRINLGNTPGPLNLPGNATQLKIGQMFSVGNDMFTVWQLGAGVTTFSTNAGATATIDSTTNPNTVVFTGEPAATPVWYYPANPIMGFIIYEIAADATDPVFVFDTQFCYQFTSGAFARVGTAIWTGSNSQFFSGTTWGLDASSRLLFVVNSNATDQIKYWNGATWTTINPTILVDGGNTYRLESAVITVVFKNRLVMLNTFESLNAMSTTQYTNRARWAAWGDPLQTDAWRQDVPGKGNALDAATMEDIVSCGFIKDRLIVFFEKSTWELVYTGNQAQPFTWQKLNTELGAESTFSAVPFDKVLLAIGSVGVHACNGVNVERIDNKIPDTVWQIYDGTASVRRIYGIRDYYAEQVYWTFPNIDTNAFSSTFPNKILVYNYKTGSWAFNDDSITAFGYYSAASQSQINWDSLDVTWDNTDITWDSGAAQTNNQEIIAGNQEGYVFIVDSNSAQNAPVLQITNIYLSNSSVVGVTNGGGDLAGVVPGASGAIGNYFYVGTQQFVVVIANGAMTVVGAPGGAAGTFNTATGAFAITGSNASTPVVFFGSGAQNVTLTVINHNLNVQEYVYIQNLNGLTGPFFPIFMVDSIVDANTFTIIAPDIQGVLATGQLYTGGGIISRVSQIDILTKQFNFYVEDDRNATVQRVDFLVDRTDSGEFTVDYMMSTSSQGVLEDAELNGSLLGSGVVETTPYDLYPSELKQDRLWHPAYLMAEGQAVQLHIYLSDTQMRNLSIATSPFQVHAMTFFAQPTTSRLQ